MLKRYAKLVLIGLMLVLPVQGTAAAVAQILCSTEDHHAPQTQSHAQHDQGTPHQHPGDDGSNKGHEHSASLCCHHIVTGAPLGLVSAGTPDLPVYQSSLTPLISLFVPEQPKRPPRA